MSFESNDGSQSSQSQYIPLSEFLNIRDDRHFVWDDFDREQSDAWLAPVRLADLPLDKHKVFNHSSKEYLKPPYPFVQQGTELGDSGTTIVYKVTAPEGYAYRRPLALKVIVCKENSRPPGPDSTARINALKEVKTMSKLKHPHIVAYVASFEDYCIQTREIKQRLNGKTTRSIFQVNQRIKKHILGIAMYPPAQCNLRTFMEEVFQGPRGAEWVIPYLHTYFGCLAQAVAYLHGGERQIRHKDIKPENIVIDEFGLPVLTDFGLSKHFEIGQPSTGPSGPRTIKYADPDAIHELPRTKEGDIFSLGCVFLEMATVLLGKPASFAEEQLSRDNNPHNPHNQHQQQQNSPYPYSVRPASATGVFTYAQSLHNLDAYLSTLSLAARELVTADPAREVSAKAVVSILPHLRAMLDPVQERRPQARDLYPLFRHLYDVHEFPGPCACCEEERVTGYAIPSLALTGVVGVGTAGVGVGVAMAGGRRSGSRSPTLTRGGTVTGAGAVGTSSGSGSGMGMGIGMGQIVRRSTVGSMAAQSHSGSSQHQASQASQVAHAQADGFVGSDSD